MTTRDRFSAPTAAKQVSRAQLQDVRCCPERDVAASLVDTLLGAHFCTFARFVTGLQNSFFSPQIASRGARVTQRPHLNRLRSEASL